MSAITYNTNNTGNSANAVKEDANVGNVHISEEVVSVIAGIAATEAEGVASLAGNITNEIVGIMGINNLSKGIKIRLGENTAILELKVNLLFGYNIADTCVAIQERVSQAVEEMTGFSVSRIDVIVNDIVTKK